MWAATPLGVEWPTIQGHLRLSENRLCITMHNSKISEVAINKLFCWEAQHSMSNCIKQRVPTLGRLRTTELEKAET